MRIAQVSLAVVLLSAAPCSAPRAQSPADPRAGTSLLPSLVLHAPREVRIYPVENRVLAFEEPVAISVAPPALVLAGPAAFPTAVGEGAASGDASSLVPRLAMQVPPDSCWRSLEIERIQSQLLRLGYHAGQANGILCDTTWQALERFQGDQELEEASPLTPRTRQILERCCEEALTPFERGTVARLINYPRTSSHRQLFSPAPSLRLPAASAPRPGPRPVSAAPASANPYHVVLFRSNDPELKPQLVRTGASVPERRMSGAGESASRRGSRDYAEAR